MILSQSKLKMEAKMNELSEVTVLGGPLERHLIAAMRDFMQSRSEPQPVFRFTIGWSRSYDALFGGQFADFGLIDSITTNALNSGRVLLSGRGGGAKSTIILRLIREALEGAHIVPILIDLKSWQAENYGQWTSLQPGWMSRFAMLLEHFGHPKANLSTLEAIHPMMSRLIFIDGLNEVTSAVAQEIFAAADDFAQKAINSSVVISDRIVRRELRDAERWRFAAIQPLSEAEIRRVLDESALGARAWEAATPETKALMEIPFFLNEFLREGGANFGAVTRSSMIRSYFDSHVELDEAVFSSAARGAFEVYRDDQSRTFPLSQFQEFAGATATEKMLTAGILSGPPEATRLSHHLHHDYLASRHLVAQPMTWNRDAFDVLTFSASSFDAVAMAIEQITDSESADLFVL